MVKIYFKPFRALVCISVITLVAACQSTKVASKKDPVILTIANTPVYRSEFQYVYEKNINAQDSLYSPKSLRNYLDLFVNFKLKVAEAQQNGIDTSQAFQEELNSYQDILAKPYLSDQQVLEKLVREAYDRQSEQISASHILVSLAPNAQGEDTVEAYQKILEIHQKAEAGENFEKLATQYSEDPSARNTGGSLGYFTSLQMVYPFENAAYLTPQGQVSDIVRSVYGYHILKVRDRKPNPGRFQVAHLMIQVLPSSSDQTKKESQQKIDSLYKALQNGAEWDNLVLKNSQDATSRTKGGLLPEFGVGEVLPVIEKAAQSIQQVNSYSQPVQSPYGWHIFKLISRNPRPSYADQKAQIKQLVEKDERYSLARNSLLKRLQSTYAMKIFEEVREKSLNTTDSSLLDGAWSYNSQDNLAYERILSFNLNGTSKNFFARDFFAYVSDKQTLRADWPDPRDLMGHYFDKFVEYQTLELEKEQLSLKYPEYRLLIKEYREGMMLFQMMTDEVWQKAIQDTSGCKQYFLKNRENYRWKQRANALICELGKPDILGQLKSYLLKGLYPVYDTETDFLYFDEDQNALDEKSIEIISEFVKTLEDNPSFIVEIAGHADPSEDSAMAQKRISPVLSYFNFKGISPDRISTKNFGNTQPISRDKSKNRRVELKLYTSDKKELEKIFNKLNQKNLKLTEGVYEKGDNPLLDRVDWKPGAAQFNSDGKLIYVEIYDLKEPRLKEYDEARGYVITDYQKVLEEKWLRELRQKYPIKINDQVVEELTQ